MLVHRQEERIANDNHECLGSRDGDVEPLGVLEEAELVLEVGLQKLRLGPDR